MTGKEAKQQIRKRNGKIFLTGMAFGAAAIGAAVCAGVSLGKESGSGKLPHFDWKGKLFGKEEADG
jgi:hypothetical protein